MGLLDEFSSFVKTPEGQGLLSAAFGGLATARRGTPFNNMGKAGLAGIMGYGNALDRNAQTGKDAQALELQKMQVDQLRKAAAKSDRIDALAQKFFTPGIPEQAGIPSDVGPMPPTPATPSRFDALGYGNALMGVDPTKGAEWMQAMQKDNTPINVAAGGTLFDRHTGKILFTAPNKEESTDPKIKQFEYAKLNGFKGSFADWVAIGPNIMAGAMAPLRAAQVENIEAENAYNLPPPRSAAKPAAPMRGQVVDGYKFKGGNPADQNNWERK